MTTSTASPSASAPSSWMTTVAPSASVTSRLNTAGAVETTHSTLETAREAGEPPEALSAVDVPYVRGLHSSTFQLNLRRFCRKLQP
jgi:hypothetical protein